MLDFVSRCKKDETLTSHRRIWRTKCDQYRVIEYTSMFERDKRGKALVRWHAEMRVDLPGCTWDMIGNNFRTMHTAQDACEQFQVA